MYNWKIDIYLKSGVKLACTYYGPAGNTTDVANSLFAGKQPNDMVGLGSREHNHNVFVLVGELAAFDIYQ